MDAKKDILNKPPAFIQGFYISSSAILAWV